MKVEIHRDTAGLWRWRLKAKNGRIIGNSAEGNHNRTHVVRMVSQIFPTIEVAVLKDENVVQ